MAYKLMIQGTMSSAGKSFIVTGLCRMFSNLGYRVAPFKSQNMALNSGVTFDGLEMGRAQIVQAEAARTIPDVRMNPVLLKPNSDIGSQVIVMGKPIGNMNAKDYYDYKKTLVPVIKDAFASLENDYDIIIVEGAGSPAEINLKENDIVNMGLAKMLDLPVLLVGDIDLGGVFAQLLGTIEWLDDVEKDRIKGLIINKFRGDISLLKPGIEMLEKRVYKEVLGVVPYCKASIDEEDSVTINLNKIDQEINSFSKNIIIYVIKLPHMSNFTDFTPLARLPFVELTYIDKCVEETPDLLIIPGTKSTISDLNWMKDNGFDKYIYKVKDAIPIMGICGGYQILGNSISDPKLIEGIEHCEALHLLDIDTVISEDKTLSKSEGLIKCKEGFFSCIDSSEYEGYEIHSGVSEDKLYSYSKDIFGTYIHGIFDSADVTKSLIKGLLQRKKEDIESEDIEDLIETISDYKNVKDNQYDIVAEILSKSFDEEKLFNIMGIVNL